MTSTSSMKWFTKTSLSNTKFDATFNQITFEVTQSFTRNSIQEIHASAVQAIIDTFKRLETSDGLGTNQLSKVFLRFVSFHSLVPI